jgi:cytochrome c oxidase assembly factor CtaG
MAWPQVLTQWSFDPSVVLLTAFAALLYWRGWRPLALVTDRKPVRGWNAAAFYGGLAVVVVALESPIDALSASLFSFHMIQHLMLIMVAAPLLMLGDPGVTVMRGLPLRPRRAALGYLTQHTWSRRLGRALATLNTPVLAFGIFTADLYLWHWSYLFNLTLADDTVHLVEHTCFLLTSLLFWAQLIDQRAIHVHLSYVRRALYGVFAGAAGNVLAMYLVFAPKPMYGYANLATRTYGMTALADQQIAGAIMWVPVLFIFGGVFAVCLFKALQEDERQSDAASQLGVRPTPAHGAPGGART